MIPPFWWLLASLTPQPWFVIQVSGENKRSSKHWAHFWWWLKQLLRWFTPKTRYSDSLLFVTWWDDHQPGTVVQLGTWLQPDHGCTFYLFIFCQEVLEFVGDGRFHVDLWWFCWMHGWRILFMITGKKKREQPASQSHNFPNHSTCDPKRYLRRVEWETMKQFGSQNKKTYRNHTRIDRSFFWKPLKGSPFPSPGCEKTAWSPVPQKMLLYLTRLVRPPLAKLRVRDSWCNDSSRYSKSKHDEMGWQVFWKLILCRGVLFYTVPSRMMKKEMGAADGRGNGAGAGVVLWRVHWERWFGLGLASNIISAVGWTIHSFGNSFSSFSPFVLWNKFALPKPPNPSPNKLEP